MAARNSNRMDKTRSQGPAVPQRKSAVQSASAESVRKRKAALPEFIAPQLATLVDRVPPGADWLHEVKFDGYRILCRIDKGQVSLLTRNRQDWTERMSALAKAAARLPVAQALLDGEVVALRDNGVADFQLLQNSLSAGRDANLAYYVFDLLHLDGRDMTAAPLVARKQELGEILGGGKAAPTMLRYSEHWLGEGERLYQEACRAGFEGIISKRANQPYRPGRGRDWLKIKCVQSQEFVIGGFTEPAGSRTGLGALLVGVHDENGELIYAGKVGTGFSRRSLTELRRRLDRLETQTAPFVNPPKGADARGVHWVEPELVGAVAFTQWTGDNLLRHPSFQGLREDKPARAVTRERAAPREPSAPRKRADEVAGVKLTHGDRVLYPEQGITKSELAHYYERIAEWILPHVAGRPLTLVRCPRGRDKHCFYQRHVTDAADDAIRRVALQQKGRRSSYVYIEDLRGLVTLVQMGVLELHTWGCRHDLIERPDRLIFDLDPDPELSWEDLRDAAQSLRGFLAGLDLEPFIKTTGGKGLHVVVPIVPACDWDTAKEFTKRVAEDMARRAPDRYTAAMAKAKRRGKIFIDYLRNAKAASAVAAYSTRARTGAPVSTPLAWDELGSDVRGDYFNVRNVPDRLRSLARDPWQGYDAGRRKLGQAFFKKL